MGGMDIIKEYLVSLGFNVDDKSFNDTNKAIDSVEKSTTKMAKGVVGDFLKAGLGITAFVATAVTGIAKYISSLGQAQIQNEIFARRMWTTQDSAMALNSTLKAMGVTLQDLYLSPTLMEQFQKLNQEARNLQAPSEYKVQMKFIQSITFEFTRMKLEAAYSLQWIGYYFVKYMAGPLGQIKTSLDNVNNIIVKTMPQWTRIIAVGLVDIVKFGQTIWWALTNVGTFLKNLTDSIPSSIKIIAGTLLLLSSPIAIIIAGLLLLQDYLTFKSGGKSIFEGLWKDLSKFGNINDTLNNIKKSINGFFDDLGKNGVGKNFEDAFKKFIDTVKILGVDFSGWFSQFLSDLNKDGTFEKIITDFSKLVDSLSTFLNDFVKNKDVQKFFSEFGKLFSYGLRDALSYVDQLIKGLTQVIEGLDKLGKFDLKGAYKAITGADDKSNKTTTPNSNSGWQLPDLLDPTNPGWFLNDSRKFMKGLFSPNVFQDSSYIYPQSSNSSNHVINNLNQTNHIYGSGGNSSTVSAIKSSASDIIRNFQGVML